MKKALAALVALGAAFSAVSWWALESGGVAVVTTQRPEGGVRETHVWYAEMDGALFIEAGTPDNPWYRDVLATPVLQLDAEEHAGFHRTFPEPDPARREALRARLRAKYGWRDRWVGMFVDSARSVPVRLEPAAGPSSGPIL